MRPARRLSALGRSEQSSRSPRPRRYRWLNPWLLPLLLPLLWWTIPPLSPATSASYSTLLLASGGELLGARIADDGQWRFPPGAALPERLAKAIVTFEDRRFHYHPGIDPIAIARAALANLQAGRIVSGGSTLTMQLARIISGNRQRGWWQKIGEAWLALRLERALTKAEIIREWADRAPFGGNVIGFETAAWRYFGREPAQLTWAEAATLAVLPNQPGLVRPGRHETRLLERRNRLLRRLATDGELTGDDLQLALLEPLPGEPADLPMTAPHLLQSLQQRHPGLHRLQTTIDARLQQTATATVARYSQALRRRGIHNAAALVIRHQPFSVAVHVGNSDWSISSQHGHAIDLVDRPRSTGSLLKPLLYATMLQSGEIAPTTLISDTPGSFSGYRPRNYDRDYRGAVPAWQALARSLNVPAVEMLQEHGVVRLLDQLRREGMTTLHRNADGYGLSLILGGAEGTLAELTTLYARLGVTLINGEPARIVRPLLLTGGEEVESNRAKKSTVGPGAAWLTLQALIEVTRPGIERDWRRFDRYGAVAWKTGTSYGLRDGWAIGITPGHTVGVWVGNADGEGRAGLTGFEAAAPLLFALIERLAIERQPFPRPDHDLREIELCSDNGMLPNGECATSRQLLPRHAHFHRITPHHHRIHLDHQERWRLDSRCSSAGSRVARSWFTLPPVESHYYRRHHTDYRPLPPLHPECSGESHDQPIELIYPPPATRIQLPLDLAGQQSLVVFSATHRHNPTRLHWHLDDHYLTTTSELHQIELRPPPGEHTVTLVDDRGNRLERRFTVASSAPPPSVESTSHDR